MKISSAKVFAVTVAALLFAALPARAQQPETGPPAHSPDVAAPPGQDTGTKGPSNGAQETGPHGPHDVTTGAEPGKPPATGSQATAPSSSPQTAVPKQ